MIPEEYFQKQEQELALAQQQASQQNIQQDAMAIQLQEETINLVQEQLSLNKEVENIKYLLQGYTLERDENGLQNWEKPESNEMKILTTYGVHLIMNTIMFYLNKNTLLSNYDEETINRKMEDFAISLADIVFMEYEKVFLYPSFEDCKKVLQERIQRKIDLRTFALETIGMEANEKEIKKEFVHEIEGNIEKEMNKIKEQIIKNKLKRFELIVREVQDAVHSTYLRAWNGQERRTLRQHIHISETMGTSPMMNPQVKPKKNWWRR